ncbi:MAG TPA: PIN domain-containing protein [Xanthobacteraceae bacterium]|nr:PIN domain-containing protein [Xanthobacteraceae bacterium]
MIVSFDTNVLVYATAPASVKADRARDVIARGMRGGENVLLLQTLAEFANVAIRKAGMPLDDARTAIDAWRAVLPVYAAEESDLAAALAAAKAHRLAFWDAMLWATARRIGVRCFLTEDLHDGLALDGVRFVNPFDPANDRLIDDILPLPDDGGQTTQDG